MIKKIIKNKWFFRLIGIAIFIFILVYKINLKETLALFNHIRISYLILAILVMIISSVIKPYRWQYILKTMNIRYSLLKIYKLYFIGLFMGLITPGRLGELGKIIYLKKDNYSLNQSLISVIIDRLADVFYLIAFGFIGFFFFLTFFKSLIVYTGIFIILGVILLLLIIKIKGFKNVFKKIILFFIPLNYKQKIEKSFSEFIENLKLYKFKNYFNIFILTVFSWLPSYVAVYFLAYSIGITSISFLLRLLRHYKRMNSIEAYLKIP